MTLIIGPKKAGLKAHDNSKHKLESDLKHTELDSRHKTRSILQIKLLSALNLVKLNQTQGTLNQSH